MKVCVYKFKKLIGYIFFDKYLTYAQIHKCLRYSNNVSLPYEKIKGLSSTANNIKFSNQEVKNLMTNSLNLTGTDGKTCGENFDIIIFKSRYKDEI